MNSNHHRQSLLNKAEQLLDYQLSLNVNNRRKLECEKLAQAYSNLAKEYLEMGYYHAAASIYNKAYRCHLEYKSYFHYWYRALERSNQLDAAEEILLKIVENEQDSPKSLYKQARFYFRLQDYNTSIRQLEKLILKNISIGMRIKAMYQIGHCLDKMGKYSEAYSAFSQASISSINSNYSSNYKNKSLAHLANINFACEWLMKNKKKINIPQNNTGKSPVFFVGFPRSGTTLIDQILESHSKIHVISEKRIADHFIASYFTDRNAMDRVNKFSTDELCQQRILYWKTANQYVTVKSDEILVDKSPLNMVHILALKILFPTAKFIVALRDPRDCILSNFMQQYKINRSMYHMQSINGASNLYNTTMHLYLLYKNILPSKDIIEVRYEDLVINLDDVSNSLMSFLELDWEKSMLNFRETALSRDISTPSYLQVTKPLYQSSINRWINYLPYVNDGFDELSEIIKKLGY
jgi:tetratricopeptide (TPR) repeat protein